MATKTIHTSGRRKRSIARATLKQGRGMVRVNHQQVNNIQPKIAQMKIREPLLLAGDIANKVDISVVVNGGGVISQADAARLAIGRALVQHSKKLERLFLEYDRQLLVADVRVKECCKPNDSKARAKRQKSYR